MRQPTIREMAFELASEMLKNKAMRTALIAQEKLLDEVEANIDTLKQLRDFAVGDEGEGTRLAAADKLLKYAQPIFQPQQPKHEFNQFNQINIDGDFSSEDREKLLQKYSS